jgi:lactoylglutathione lyase
MALQFRYTGFFVNDVPATVAFYDEAFGFRLRYMHPSSGYAELETGDTLLCFVSDAFVQGANLLGGMIYVPNKANADPAAAQVAFVTDNMEADWARALAAGASIVKPPEAKPWGQTAGYLRDCNGVIVELNTRSPRDGA